MADEEAPPTQPEHPSVNDRQRLATVVSYSIQLLLLISSFLFTNVEGPIHHYFINHEDVRKLFYSFMTAFHLLFVFSLFSTIVQRPRNGSLIECLVLLGINFYISIVFVHYFKDDYTKYAIIFWVSFIVLIIIFKRKDFWDQLKFLLNVTGIRCLFWGIIAVICYCCGGCYQYCSHNNWFYCFFGRIHEE